MQDERKFVTYLAMCAVLYTICHTVASAVLLCRQVDEGLLWNYKILQRLLERPAVQQCGVSVPP